MNDTMNDATLIAPKFACKEMLVDETEASQILVQL